MRMILLLTTLTLGCAVSAEPSPDPNEAPESSAAALSNGYKASGSCDLWVCNPRRGQYSAVLHGTMYCHGSWNCYCIHDESGQSAPCNLANTCQQPCAIQMK